MREQARELFFKGGVIPALPLVLKDDRSFDEEGQRRLIRYYMHAGADGLAVAVHTTQFAIRDKEVGLFEPLIRMAMEEITAYQEENGRTVIAVCGVCGEREQAVREAKLACEAGYDAVLLSPGGLGHLSEEDLIERTRAIASILPVIAFYLQPSVGGRMFSFKYWKELCGISGVVGVKAAPFNRYGTLDVVRAVKESGRADEIALYTGNDDNIVLDLLTGFRFDQNEEGIRFAGGLLGHWAVWTSSVVRMFRELKNLRGQDTLSAGVLTLAAQITDCNAAFFDTANGFKGCIAGIHEVLRRQGLMNNILTLDPGEGMSPGQADEIDRVYAAYPQLNDDAFVMEFLSSQG